MTGPVTTEALRDALARSAIEAKFGPEGVSVIFDTPDEAADHQRAVLAARAEEARRVADFAIAGPLAPLLAALQQVTAESDEYAEALMKVAEVGGWQASAGLYAEVQSALARLRAEGEALRAALTEIRDHPENHDDGLRSYAVKWAFWNIQNIARTALARAATVREGA